MDAQTIILGFLTRGEKTGYELKQYFSISFSFFSGLSYGSIYPALRRMTQQGLVTMLKERQEHAPDRKVYTITEKGREVFLDALRGPIAPNTCRSPFLMRLFFFEDLSPADRLALVRNHMETVRQQYRGLEAAQPQVEANADTFQYLCFQFGMRYYKDLLANVEEVLHALQNGKTADKSKRKRS
ncbi:MAG: PadR family transcriptional regulator [Desulfatitalea sp.]